MKAAVDKNNAIALSFLWSDAYFMKAIPTGIGSSFTGESESHSGIRGLRSCHCLVELDHLIF